MAGKPGRPSIDAEEVAKRRRVSARHALTDQEREFCRIYLGFGETHANDAYRRAYLVEHEGSWYDPLPDGKPNTDKKRRTSESIAQLVRTLLDSEPIQSYLQELKASPGDHARSYMADTIRFGQGREARDAAREILSQEDKLGQRDAAELWGETMCEVGAEVVVPLPTHCHSCGARQEVAVEIKELFPQWKKVSPPD